VFAFRTKARANRYGYVEAKLARWLKEQPRPLGLMCCNDDCAREVLDTALVAGINVPDDIAVVGVDNDDILCDLCNPPLSSVIPDAFKTGYLAAELLNRVMSGQKVQEQSIAVAPVGVQTRQSTDVVAVSDHRISSAVRFIRENANKNICVKDVLQAVPMSRTILDASFKKLFRCTPHDHILRVRVELVKTLLRTTDLSLAAIADRTGFEHVEYMSVVFKRAMGFPPGHYRSQRIKSESRNELAI
jgi:LacI family transcriptional regulator